MRDVIRLGASLTQLAVALFLILAALGQSATRKRKGAPSFRAGVVEVRQDA